MENIKKNKAKIAYNTPKELREMNTVVFAHQFAHGSNPYSYAALNNGTPPPTSIYGLVVPLLMSPFIHLFSLVHLNSLQACELLTLMVEVVGTVFFYRLLRARRLQVTPPTRLIKSKSSPFITVPSCCLPLSE